MVVVVVVVVVKNQLCSDVVCRCFDSLSRPGALGFRGFQQEGNIHGTLQHHSRRPRRTLLAKPVSLVGPNAAAGRQVLNLMMFVLLTPKCYFLLLQRWW